MPGCRPEIRLLDRFSTIRLPRPWNRGVKQPSRSITNVEALVGTFNQEKALVGALSGHCETLQRLIVSSTLEGLVSEAGVALGLQQVVAEVHDHEPGEGVEQPAAHHAQLVVVQPQLLQPRHRREQRRGQRHDAVTCNI